MTIAGKNNPAGTLTPYVVIVKKNHTNMNAIVSKISNYTVLLNK